MHRFFCLFVCILSRFIHALSPVGVFPVWVIMSDIDCLPAALVKGELIAMSRPHSSNNVLCSYGKMSDKAGVRFQTLTPQDFV